MVFFGTHYDFSLLKLTKFCHFEWNGSEISMLKFSFKEWYNFVVTAFRAKGVCH